MACGIDPIVILYEILRRLHYLDDRFEVTENLHLVVRLNVG